MSHDLNAAQQQAVTHTGSPLAVLAGPGTGKTRVIVERVAHLIRERGVEPERIIACTFTIKAAAQLKEKLAQLVGGRAAARVRASTTHSMGASLVTRFADVVGLPPRAAMIDRVQQSREVRAAMQDVGAFPDAVLAGIGATVEKLAKLFDTLGDGGISPARAQTAAQAWMDRLEHDAQSGPPTDPAVRAAEVEHAKYFAQASRVFDAYCTRRWRAGKLTYSDFVLLPVMGLAQDASMRTIVRGETRAMVVDEFQDCNPGLLALLRLMMGDGHPDLCVVGDDDQAIYGFRGADQHAFARFATLWPAARIIELTQNYRCAPPILGVANHIIQRAHTRFRPEKRVEPTPDAHGRVRTGGVEIVRSTPDASQEEAASAMIVAARDAGVALREVAVVARTHAHLDEVASTLDVLGIPWSRPREASIFEDAGVEGVLAWAACVADERAEGSLSIVLTRSPVSVPPATLGAWLSAWRRERALGDGAPESVRTFEAWLAAHGSSADLDARERAAHAIGTLHKLRTGTQGLSGEEALDLIVRTTGAAHAQLLPPRERARRVRALVALLRLAREKQSALAQPAGLRELLAYIEEGRSVDKHFGSVGEGGEEPAESGERDEGGEESMGGRVQLLTVHAAKGLEFRQVYVLKVQPQSFPSSSAGRDRGDVVLPDGLLSDVPPDEHASMDEERRAFYVACTRAKEKLVILGNYTKGVSTAAENYIRDLTVDGPSLEIPLRMAAEVIGASRGTGLGAARDALERMGLTFAHRRGRAEALDAALRAAREDAARLLEQASRGAADAARLDEVAGGLARAARAAAISAWCRNHAGESCPAWLHGEDPTLRALAEKLTRAGDGGHEGAMRLPAPRPPLHLSYSSIKKYLDCPRCWFVQHVWRLPERVDGGVMVGSVVHNALEQFGKAWASADAEGQALPQKDALLRMGRGAIFGADRSTGPTLDDEARVEALLTAYWDQFHVPSAHLVETEWRIEFPYEVDGVSHTMEAKLDRVEMIDAEAVRVVDYKTGGAPKSQREPPKDDLQMGIYKLALMQEYGDGLRGTAEYWMLAAGVRGVIGFDALDDAKVRKKIDTAVRGILAGEFDKGSSCSGSCDVLGA